MGSRNGSPKGGKDFLHMTHGTDFFAHTFLCIDLGGGQVLFFQEDGGEAMNFFLN